MRRPRNAFLLGLALSLGVGFFLAGSVLYRTFIGLDADAFPAGELLQRIGSALVPNVAFSLAGMMLAGLLLLVCGALTFWLVRRSARASTDPARRSFLTGAASGAGAAVVATAAGGALAFARAFLGLGNEGRGWRGPAT